MGTKTFTEALRRVAHLSDDQWEEVNALEKEYGVSVGRELFEKKIISEIQRLEALSMQYDHTFWPDLPLDQINTEFTEQVPIHFLKKHIIDFKL